MLPGLDVGPVAASTAPLRWYRCRDCLGVFTTPDDATLSPACGVCGARCDFQGLTAHVRTFNVSPCDDRCCTARGRNCECACGGKNHGTWRSVSVTRTVGIATLGAPRDAAKLAAGVAEFRAAREAADAAIETRFGDVFRLKSSGAWLDGHDFARWLAGRDFRNDVREAGACKVHSLRLEKLRKLTERVTGWRP